MCSEPYYILDACRHHLQLTCWHREITESPKLFHKFYTESNLQPFATSLELGHTASKDQSLSSSPTSRLSQTATSGRTRPVSSPSSKPKLAHPPCNLARYRGSEMHERLCMQRAFQHQILWMGRLRRWSGSWFLYPLCVLHLSHFTSSSILYLYALSAP